jgi:hypothetical protein
MSKYISISGLLILMLGLSACAEPTAYSGNSPEQQRSNSREAQKELSTDVKR